MIYRRDQIALWPRLIHAARKTDTQLAEVLEDLMQRGAHLRQKLDGAFELGPGNLGQAEYNRIRSEWFVPRSAKMKNIMQQARQGSHPWLLSIMQAFTAVDERARKGSAKLQQAYLKKNYDWIRGNAARVLERHYQAHLLSEALWVAGYGAYEEPHAYHFTGVMELQTACLGLGYEFRATGYAWPVQTPDGWIWVSDIYHTEDGQPFTPPPAGDRDYQEGELIIGHWDLGRALTLDFDDWAREAS